LEIKNKLNRVANQYFRVSNKINQYLFSGAYIMESKLIIFLLISLIISIIVKCNIFNPENQQENDLMLSKSFSCFPNPFGNITRPTTLFTYYLSEDTDVQIKIYTEYRRLVWKCHYTKHDPQGKKGIHEGDIVWNGHDEQGEKVINGIYNAYILTSSGKYATTRISIVR